MDGNMTRADRILTGFFLGIGVAEAANLAMVMFGLTFSECVKLFVAGVGLLLLATILFWVLLKGKRSKNLRGMAGWNVKEVFVSLPLREKIVYMVFTLLVLLQVWSIVRGENNYIAGDMTVESVNTMLSADTVAQINPMTGQAYALGIPTRLKLLCLPTLYAILCRLFSVNAVTMVWIIVPILMLLLVYLVYYILADILFGKEPLKKGVFLLFVAVLLLFGDYLYGMEGFGVLCAGYRGVSIRMAILVPYMVSLCLRRQWKMVPLCLLAEACITWTLYGLGACAVVFALMLVLTKGLVRKGEDDGRVG